MSGEPHATARTAWWRGQAARRVLVAVSALAWVALVALAVALPGAENEWPWLLVLVVFLAGWALARTATGDIAEGRADRLDERETAIRLRLSRIGYVAAVSAGLLAALLLIVLQDSPDLLARGGAAVLSLVVGAAALPTFVWCWSADEPYDDED